MVFKNVVDNLQKMQETKLQTAKTGKIFIKTYNDLFGHIWNN